MAKRSRKGLDGPAAPSPKEMLRWSAENMARNAVEAHPKFKKVRDAITEAVVAATEKALSKTLRGGKG